ncbi:MAG: cyanophycinase [Tannerella sp.]|jgi:cyanophycinase|nr:cyanophycinase [Tannerella sp.]
MKTSFIISLLYLGLFTAQVRAQNPIATDTALTTRHGPEQGSLVIIGGGDIGDEIWDKFIELAGGKDSAFFVVVTNATPTPSEYITNSLAGFEKRIGKNRFSVLNLKTIREANDEKNLRDLKKATGVFFIGGRQWRISEVYLNTLAHQEFFNVLARGGVIAGTSAGASIQGSFLWRGDTKGHHIIAGDHTQGLGFLRNSAIDQHILTRNRQADLSEFIRIAPQFIGIGIDESTAAVVGRDTLEVIGKSYTAIHDAKSLPFFFLREGQKYDLKERRIIRPPRRPRGENNNPQPASEQ